MMPVGKRFSDLIVEVIQQNGAQRLLVADINDVACATLGYQPEEIKGEAFNPLLPERLNDVLTDFVEYEENGRDLSEVLGRMTQFVLKDRTGREIPLGLRVHRANSSDPDNPHFILVMKNLLQQQEIEQLKVNLKANFKGHEILDPLTKLPNEASMRKDLELICYQVASGKLKAGFALLQIDGMEEIEEEYSKEAVGYILVEAGKRLIQVMREDDTIGSFGRSRYGVILMEATEEGARMAVNRLRWHLDQHPIDMRSGNRCHITVSVSYTGLRSDDREDRVIRRCETALEKAISVGGNHIELAGES